MRTPHTACKRGKKVKVILRDGTQIIDHFEDRTDKWVVLKEHGRVMKSDIRAFMILKEISCTAKSCMKQATMRKSL